jgi:hypothetical protein
VRTRLAIALLAFSAAVPAQELGTLFHSRQEREVLDRIRRGEPVEQARSAAPLPEPVVTGFVKRSDGRSTVFIDKRPYPARDPRMQGVLEPRIVERYEPIPLPPPTAAPAGEEPGEGAKVGPAKKEPRSPSQGGKAE